MSLLEDYFETYLPYSRGLSRNTIESYKQSFMLYSIKLNNDTHRRFHLPEKNVIKIYLV